MDSFAFGLLLLFNEYNNEMLTKGNKLIFMILDSERNERANAFIIMFILIFLLATYRLKDSVGVLE